ncbi:MAG: aspartate--tRNA ligase [Candidatus Woesearchaeota archaeon]
MRTHTCSDLRSSDISKEVQLVGWSQRIRDHGGKKFIDLRDREGITQVVFDPFITKNFEIVETLRRESVIQIMGKVSARPQGTVNEKHKTGEIEVIVSSFKIINNCEVLPFDIDEEHYKDVNEELRLEYRYLDLRRPQMQKSLINRSKFIHYLRNYMQNNGFIEVETPILTASSPEGARDFIVPSRKSYGSGFALPQAPQLFKQMLMVSGLEKYYQIAKCFRDEDLRKDRQYEFTQLDVEQSFTSQEELFKFVEGLIISSFRDIYGVEIEGEVKHITFQDAMDKYGCDKPDLRIQMDALVDISELAKTCGFAVFANNAKSGGLVKGLRLENGQELLTRNEIDKLIVYAQKELGSKGLAWMRVMGGDNNKISLDGSIVKFFSEDEQQKIISVFNAKANDLLFFISDSYSRTNEILDGLRRHLAQEFNLIETNKHYLSWTTDFPLFKWDDDKECLDFEHNPFTMPLEKDVEFIMSCTRVNLKENKEKLLCLVSDCYDLVYNGVEISSGAQRISNPKLQEKVFELTGWTKDDIEANFGWFTRAYTFGAPPHRGFALGIDRIIMILEGKVSIRDVIAFPRNKHGFDPLTKSPAPLKVEQLKDLGLGLSKRISKNK